MRLVAVDSATSWHSASRMAAQASAPSWMKVLCAERTTTMLASSAATSSAPRMTSEVIWSSIVDVMESGARFVGGLGYRACGAGDGNRTRVARLEVWDSAIELHPRAGRTGVGEGGIEPPTSCSQSRCARRCATPRDGPAYGPSATAGGSTRSDRNASVIPRAVTGRASDGVDWCTWSRTERSDMPGALGLGQNPPSAAGRGTWQWQETQWFACWSSMTIACSPRASRGCSTTRTTSRSPASPRRSRRPRPRRGATAPTSCCSTTGSPTATAPPRSKPCAAAAPPRAS